MPKQQSSHPQSVAGTIARCKCNHMGSPLANLRVTRVERVYRNARGDNVFVAVGLFPARDHTANLEVRIRGVLGEPGTVHVF